MRTNTPALNTVIWLIWATSVMAFYITVLYGSGPSGSVLGAVTDAIMSFGFGFCKYLCYLVLDNHGLILSSSPSLMVSLLCRIFSLYALCALSCKLSYKSIGPLLFSDCSRALTLMKCDL
jgi:hypothetical protein